MKKTTLILASITLTLFALLGATRASAQIFANDDAGVYAGNPWKTGTNYGFGLEPWVLYNTNGATGFAGNFLSSGDAIGSTNGEYWGLYANNSATAVSEAFRGFSNSIPVNATFKIRWHNNGIGNNAYNAGGFNLRNGDNTNLQTAATFLSDGSVLAFYYIGGSGNNYEIYDGNGVNPAPISFGDGNNGLTVEITILPNSMYNLLVENGAGTVVLTNAYNQPLINGSSIDSVAIYDVDASGNQNFNDIGIFYTPPQIVNLTPVSGTVYNPSTPTLSFAVTSLASTINSNQIRLTLNGAVQTGANWTVLNSGTSSNQVTLNSPLQPNLVYNGTIFAVDANNNSVSNNFTFNTWMTDPTNIYIEAGDYNYQGGGWINNFTTTEPNQNYGFFDLLGEQGIDYNVYNLAYTNNQAPYRANDLPYLEPATDVDHDNFLANDFTNYDMGYNDYSQWEDYTRQLSNNITYAVYARVSGFPGGVMQLERMATPEVSTANQPGATLGQFNIPNTGDAQNWTFVPLTDFFSNPVLVNFTGTNTFRTTDIGGDGAYNWSYMVLVAVTNSATLRPYLTAGYPYSNAGPVGPEQQVSFTIANRSTSVVPGSIQLFLNGTNITSETVISNNAAGAFLAYQPLYPNQLPGGTNTLGVIFGDGSVTQTNSWQFTVQTLQTLPTAWALPLTSGYSRGISEQIAKADDSSTNIDFPANLVRAVAQLAGTLTNSITDVPYANEALNGGAYTEPDDINYALVPSFVGLNFFAPTNPFPDIVPGGTNDVAMAANMYVYLTPGVYNFDVYSDDGFQFAAGPTPTSTNMILGIFDGGRAPSATEFSFLCATNGLYPMQLIYFKAQFGGGGVQLYSINATNGASVLLNDTSNTGAVQVYYLSGNPVLNISLSGTQVVLTWSAPSYSLQSASVVGGPYTTINGATSPYHYTITSTQEYFRLAH